MRSLEDDCEDPADSSFRASKKPRLDVAQWVAKQSDLDIESLPEMFSSPSESASMSSASSQSSSLRKVSNPTYRQNVCIPNNVYLRSKSYQQPENVRTLVGRIQQDRISPQKPVNSMELEEYQLQNSQEAAIVDFCKRNQIFLPPTSTLAFHERIHLSKSLVPYTWEQHEELSQPYIDGIYCYKHAAFPENRRSQLPEAITTGSQLSTSGFFAYKANRNGEIWVATTQLLGGLSTMVNSTKRFNKTLADHQKANKIPSNLVDCTAFGMTFGAFQAQLLVCWPEGDKFVCQIVDTFDLSQTARFAAFRSAARNIQDWGKERLNTFKAALETLYQEPKDERGWNWDNEENDFWQPGGDGIVWRKWGRNWTWDGTERNFWKYSENGTREWAGYGTGWKWDDGTRRYWIKKGEDEVTEWACHYDESWVWDKKKAAYWRYTRQGLQKEWADETRSFGY